MKIKQIIPLPLKDFSFNESDIWKNNYRVFNNKIYQIVGHSSVGKSTLINIIIWFADKNIKHISLNKSTKTRHTKLTYIFQELHLFEELTLMENIQLKNVIKLNTLIEKLVRKNLSILRIITFWFFLQSVSLFFY